MKFNNYMGRYFEEKNNILYIDGVSAADLVKSTEPHCMFFRNVRSERTVVRINIL